MTSIFLAGLVFVNSTASGPAQSAYSRTFNGADQYGTYSVQPITAFPVTMCAWIKMSSADQTPVQQSIIVAMDNAVNGSWQLALEWGSIENKVYVSVKPGSGNRRVPSDSTVSTDAWHHACAVFEEAANVNQTDKRLIYLDADPGTDTADSTGSYTVFGGSNPPSQFHVGVKSDSSPGSLQSYFKGKIAHVAIWNRILSAAEIADLAGEANGGTNGTANNPLNALYTTNLVAYYPFVYNSGEDVDGTYDLTFSTNPPGQSTDVPTIEAAP